MEFFYAFGGFFFPFGFLVLGALVLASFVIPGRRAAPDPTGRRPFAIYLLSVMFITLFTAAGAVASVGAAIAREAVNDDALWAVTVGRSFATNQPLDPEGRHYELYGLTNRTIAAELLRAALVGLLATAFFESHRRQWRQLLRKERGDG